MELLRSHLSRVRIPESTNSICIEECCISFDTPKSDGGLFVDMNTFLAFGKDFVFWNFEKTGNPVYLRIRETQLQPHDEWLSLSQELSLLGIGFEDGTDPKEPEYTQRRYQLVILPNFVTLPFPSAELPEKVRLAVNAVIFVNNSAEKKEQVASWPGDSKHISKHAVQLEQLENGVVIPPSGWKCEKCDKTDNLWLNLTDGSILCSRKSWKASGGNGHSMNHYIQTKYPLAVKLGTITSDLDAADVFSYEENASVFDPLLAQHLQHFGIDFSSLQKTEMTADGEFDHNTNFDPNQIQESGDQVGQLFEPGYTGLVNLGNSCYLAAIMQVVFSTSGFCSRYYVDQSLKAAFDISPANPTIDLNMQLTKLAHGMLSGRYSNPASKKQGIPPRMFKSVIAANHPDFSSTEQQDALDFFLHLIDQVQRIHVREPGIDPSRSFKFGIEERVQCSSGKVKYIRRNDCVLHLSIPIDKAINNDDLEQFWILEAQAMCKGKEMSPDEIVRPKITLKDCLDSFSGPEKVPDYYSSELMARTTAIKTTGLTSFPDYLILHMKIYAREKGRDDSEKLDVCIDVPDTIDISYMRSNGLQPGEELLPEENAAERSGTNADESIVSHLSSMGSPDLQCKKVAIGTSNEGTGDEMNLLSKYMNDLDLDEPSTISQKSTQYIDPSNVETLMSFGVDEEVARSALLASHGKIEDAIEQLFSFDYSTGVEKPLSDGSGKYKLMGFVSHIGTSIHSGHYVAHVNKNEQWTILDDEKVSVTENPPIDMGYIYCFERMSS